MEEFADVVNELTDFERVVERVVELVDVADELGINVCGWCWCFWVSGFETRVPMRRRDSSEISESDDSG